jgi:hypothetical protein
MSVPQILVIFGPWISNTHRYVGYGFDVRNSNQSTIHVFVYANDPPSNSATVLNELYTYLGKFSCSQIPDPLPFEDIYDMLTIGDIKVSLVASQGNGWWNLNGQTISGDAVAQANAVVIFGSTTLPNFTYKYLQRRVNTKEFVSSNKRTLIQSHLPNANLPLTYIGSRADPPDGILAWHMSGSNLGWTGGGSYGDIPANEYAVKMNTGTQVPLDITPSSVGVKYQVFLDMA